MKMHKCLIETCPAPRAECEECLKQMEVALKIIRESNIPVEDGGWEK